MPAAFLENDLFRAPLLQSESEDSWQTLHRQWFKDYRPESACDRDLVFRTVKADWALRREEVRHNHREARFTAQHSDPLCWGKTQQSHFAFITRRLAAAERRFLHLRGLLEQTRRQRLQEKIRLHQWNSLPAKLPSPSPADTTSRAASAPPVEPTPPDARPSPFLQSIHIEVRDGLTHTIYNPENDFLQQMVAQLGRDGQNVQRMLHFPEVIPPEYLWVTLGSDSHPQFVRWVMTPQRFEEELLREKRAGTGHLVPDIDQYSRETVLLG